MAGLMSMVGGALSSSGSDSNGIAGLLGLGGAGGAASQATSAANTTDPMQQYRGYFANQLYSLYSNPNAFLQSNPVYQAEKTAGTNAVEGSAAATGQLNSGNTLSALNTEGSNLAAENIWGNIGTLSNLASPNSGTQNAYQAAGKNKNIQNGITANDIGQGASWSGSGLQALGYK